MNMKNLTKQNKHLVTAFLVIINLFLIVLIISAIVGTQNNIKRGKYIGQEIESRNTLSVSDTGTVYIKPDLALISFSVITEGKTVAETMSENTTKMNKIIDVIKEQKVKDKDLKTTDFNIYPRYEWKKQAEVYPPSPGKRVLVGYEVRQSLQVKIRDMEKIGDIVQQATDAGANQVGNLQFTIDDQDEVKKQAREQAIEKAKQKAKELAKQLGVNLVRITNFSESGVFPRYYGLSKAAPAMAEEAVPSPQIQTGENKIEVTVTITYEIN